MTTTLTILGYIAISAGMFGGGYLTASTVRTFLETRRERRKLDDAKQRERIEDHAALHATRAILEPLGIPAHIHLNCRRCDETVYCGNWITPDDLDALKHAHDIASHTTHPTKRGR